MYAESAGSNARSSSDRGINMYKNIVVAYDGSEYSKSALMEASNWIKRHGGSAVLVHAVFFDEEEFGTIPDQLEKRMNFGKKICHQAKEEASSALGLNLESIICEGEPPDTIAEIAQAKKADLIAIGTHGRKGIKKLLMGSVTSGLIGKAPCDVLVVKKLCTACSGMYESVLVPFDGSECGKQALKQACRIASLDGSAVTVLYVIPRYEEMIGFYRSSSIKSSLMNEAQKITERAGELALENGIRVKVLIEDGDVSGKISEIAGKEGNDLIVMGSYGWSGINKAVIGSNTERVIMHANCPILVVR
jgi:nucleotide-binding universal stress UspA family protein